MTKKEKILKKENRKVQDKGKKEILEAKKEKTVEEELEEYKDKYCRLYAEFDNARKRMEKEKIDFIRYANEGLITEFLTILDNLELSVKAAKEKHEDYEAFLKGIEMVLAHTHDLLKKNGVVALEAKGNMFDPNLHEVLMQEESCEKENKVLEEFQKGYKLYEKVIRTTKVKLSKKISQPQVDSETAENHKVRE